MDIEMYRLMAMHDVARWYGCGLKPMLCDAIRQSAGYAPEGSTALNAPVKSAGPKQQSFTRQDLADLDIPQLGMPIETVCAKKRADA